MIYKIRQASENDAESIHRLIVDRVEWFEKNNMNQWNKEYLSFYPVSFFESEAKLGHLYCAEDAGLICGGFILLDEDERWKGYEDNAYYIHNLVSEVGKSGLGTQMISWCKEKARENNKKYLRLDKLHGNYKIQEYYERQGFYFVDTFNESYYRGDLMQCDICK